MKYGKPYVGQQIGHWTITDSAITIKNGNYYVLCKCTCGKILQRNYHSLMNGGSTSCGCQRIPSLDGIIKWKKENGAPNKKPKGEAALNELFNRYRYSARKKGITFYLSKEELRTICQKPCHYCGDGPSAQIKNPLLNGIFVYNGIDRKDNKKGYEIENSLPCCKTCNFLKKDMDYVDFIDLIHKIGANVKK